MQHSIAANFYLAFISLFYWQPPKEKKNMPPTQQKWSFVLPPLFSDRKEFNYWFRLKAFELHRLNKQPPGFRAFHPPAMANHFPYHLIGETVNALLFQLSVQDNNSPVCETENGQWKEPHPDKDRLGSEGNINKYVWPWVSPSGGGATITSGSESPLSPL